MVDFRKIQHFVHIAELGSLSKAAERLNIVQPALSQSLKRLESELNTTLFTRSRRGMELTDSGHTFLKHAYGILSQYNRAKESLSATDDNPKGQVSIAMTASALEVLSLPVSLRLRQIYPAIRLNIDSGLAANIQEGLDAGNYDLVVSHLLKPESAIRVEPLIEEDLFLVSPYSSDNMGEDFEFKDLDDLPLILPHEQHGVAPNIKRLASEAAINISFAQVTGTLHTTLKLVEAGFGNSILPWSAIYERVQQNRVSARKLINPSLNHKVSLVSPSHRPLTPASIAVMDLIRQAAREVHLKGKWSGTLLIPTN